MRKEEGGGEIANVWNFPLTCVATLLYFLVLVILSLFIVQLSGMLKKFSTDDEEELAENYISDIIERFAHSKKWNRRQM